MKKRVILKQNACLTIRKNTPQSRPKVRRPTRIPVVLKGAREKIAENAIHYRAPMEVTQIISFSEDGQYPVCPRCNITIEREYMHFCDRCGQKLGWTKFGDALVVYQ